MMAPWMLTPCLLLAWAPFAPAQNTSFEGHRREAEMAYKRGEDLMRAESFEEAASEFRTAIKMDPNLWLARYGLGQSQMALKEYEAAIDAYAGCREVLQKAASLDGAERARYEALRVAERNELRDSLQRVRSGQLKIGPTQAAVLEAQMEERLRILETPKGQEQRNGVPAALMLALGSAHFRAGQRPEARKAYEEAVNIDRKLGAAHNNLAVLHMLDGRYVEAKEAMKRAEKSGFAVSSAFKDDLAKRASAASNQQ